MHEYHPNKMYWKQIPLLMVEVARKVISELGKEGRLDPAECNSKESPERLCFGTLHPSDYSTCEGFEISSPNET